MLVFRCSGTYLWQVSSCVRSAEFGTPIGVFRMDYRVQIYCENEDRVPAPLGPESVRATSPKEAAETLCGKGLIDKGHIGKLAAKVWAANSNPPDIKLFYRP
jgi:hypothetical protein